MVLYIEKAPIIMVSTTPPFIVANMFAHRLIDDDTSRIVKLSTIGGELNTLQHYGHNSREVIITGRINLVVNSTVQGLIPESVLTFPKIWKETKSAILLIMNHSIMYGIIENIKIIDDKDYPTSFDYEISVVEKDLFGLKFSAIAQRFFSAIIPRPDATSLISDPSAVIPSFSDVILGG